MENRCSNLCRTVKTDEGGRIKEKGTISSDSLTRFDQMEESPSDLYLGVEYVEPIYFMFICLDIHVAVVVAVCNILQTATMKLWG